MPKVKMSQGFATITCANTKSWRDWRQILCLITVKGLISKN